MIGPLICGMQDCVPVVRRGDHGFMKSIEKDLHKTTEENLVNVLKQKISLKHIANRHSKTPSSQSLKPQNYHRETVPDIKKVPPCEPLKFQSSQRAKPGANNPFSQYGELQQNRRNLICLKNNTNHQIHRHKAHPSLLEKTPHVTEIISKNIEVITFRHTSGHSTSTNFNQNNKNPIHFVKPQEFNPLSTFLQTPKIRQSISQPEKENVPKIMTSNKNFDNFINRKQPIDQKLSKQISSGIQENIWAPYKSFKMARKTQQLPSPILFQQKNQQNKEPSSHQNFSRQSMVGSAGKITISQVKESNYRLADKIDKQNERPFRSSIVSEKTKIEPKTQFEERKSEKIEPISPFNEISELLDMNKAILDASKSPTDETLTRENSKLSILPGENTKNSILTTKTNDSHFSEYQNQKEFENRFNVNRFLNTRNFGVHSYLEQVHSGPMSKPQPIPNSEKQIKAKEKSTEKQAKLPEDSEIKRIEQLMKERKQKKNAESHLRKRTSLEMREFNFRSAARGQTNKNEISIVCYEPKNYQVQEQPNTKREKEESNRVRCHKKNRSSFFQEIEKKKHQNNLTMTKASNFSNTVKSESCGQELKELSMFNMKDAESVVDEDEDRQSEADSELEYVVHSCSNVKLKSFALLKNSMFAVKPESAHGGKK